MAVDEGKTEAGMATDSTLPLPNPYQLETQH
jgi:hypothetical protein